MTTPATLLCRGRGHPEVGPHTLGIGRPSRDGKALDQRRGTASTPPPSTRPGQGLFPPSPRSQDVPPARPCLDTTSATTSSTSGRGSLTWRMTQTPTADGCRTLTSPSLRSQLARVPTPAATARIFLSPDWSRGMKLSSTPEGHIYSTPVHQKPILLILTNPAPPRTFPWTCR